MNNPKFNTKNLDWSHHIEEEFDPKTGKLELLISWRDNKGEHYGTWLRIDPNSGPVYHIADGAVYPLMDLNVAHLRRDK